MPKLPVIGYKKLAKFLEKLGFQRDHATGSHFILAIERRYGRN